MAEAFFNATEGSGKKWHAFDRVIGANTVLGQVVLQGEPYLATYVTGRSGASWATASDHIFQLMAGASLNLYIRRIRVWQLAMATTAAVGEAQVIRLATAGTGGTTNAINPLDSSDAAAGATSQSLPTAKGTEGVVLWRGTAMFIQTVPTGGPGGATLLYDFDFTHLLGKAVRVPAGTANGICLKNTTAVAASTVTFTVEFAEANF
jgi:hypothetical protein